MSLLVGAGKKEIEIPQAYLAAENFGEIHDPLHARVMALKTDELILIVSFEFTSLMGEEVTMIKEKLNAVTGATPSNIWVCATHSFSSPHLMPDEHLANEEQMAARDSYRHNLHQAAVSAAQDAVCSMKEAVLSIGRADCPIVANRDVELADGWWVGVKGTGLTDQTVTTLSFAEKEGKPIAVIYHFGMQSSVMDQSTFADGKKPVTSDVVGLACAKVEQQLGAVTLFLIGAAGDQSPTEKAVTDTFEDGQRVRTDLGEEGFTLCERFSDALGKAVIESVGKARKAEVILVCQKEMLVEVPAQKMKGNVHTLVPTRHYDFEYDGVKEMKVEMLKIGDTALIGVTPELCCTTAEYILSQSSFAHTLVCTMVNGAAKYMADESSFDRCTYEAMNSPWYKGAAEKLAQAAIRLLNG